MSLRVNFTISMSEICIEKSLSYQDVLDIIFPHFRFGKTTQTDISEFLIYKSSYSVTTNFLWVLKICFHSGLYN